MNRRGHYKAALAAVQVVSAIHKCRASSDTQILLTLRTGRDEMSRDTATPDPPTTPDAARLENGSADGTDGSAAILAAVRTAVQEEVQAALARAGTQSSLGPQEGDATGRSGARRNTKTSRTATTTVGEMLS